MRLLEKMTGLWRRVSPLVRERGVVPVAVSCGGWATGWVRGRLRAEGPSRRTFVWEGQTVPYAHYRYHYTWLNERAVEVALAEQVVASRRWTSVLEIGNVLGHYLPVDHTVVDKYEEAPGVLNVDVADLDLDSEFDLVLAISTLEHVGLDEDVLDPEKPGRAIEALKGLLAPGGLLWVTFPVGYNAALDQRLRAGDYGFDNLRALRRQGRRNIWTSVPVEQIWTAGYDRLLYTAHGIVVAEYRRSEGHTDKPHEQG